MTSIVLGGGIIKPGMMVAWSSPVGDWRGKVLSLRQNNFLRVEMHKPVNGVWGPSGTIIDLNARDLRPMIAARGEDIAKMSGAVECKSTDAVTELSLYGDIGPNGGITAKAVSDALKGKNDTGRLNVYISSPGGSPFEGIAIGSVISRWRGRSTAYIDGLAASAATLIPMATDTAMIAQDGTFMIHRASTMAFGDRDEMMHTIKILEQVDMQMARLYARKTGMRVEELLDKMSEEWWMDAPTAHKRGFVDGQVTPPKKNANATTAMHDRPWFARSHLGALGTNRPGPETGSSTATAQVAAGLQSPAPASTDTGAAVATPPTTPAAPESPVTSQEA